MRVLAVADIHDRLDNVRRVAGVERDVALVAGDFTYSWSAEAARRTLEILAQGSPVYYVAGNMDPGDAFGDLGLANAVQLHGRVVQKNGVYFAGLGYVGEGEAEAVLGRLRGLRPLVLLTHSPPYGVLDKAYSGERLGNKALRRFIEAERPVLVVSGHVHEARGVEKIGETLVVNPGPLMRGYYAFIELEAGRAEAELLRL
ncbi:MAG: metallophosphoesterase family protein [Thermoproteus sp. AZ2]|jgi:Icc-related predicted phosphoesterase|uniref:Metallophosphoesterase family protein n=1 Tax=Thermoproteus sp. AZ2 TaxID=1609232 RepID=A0ACC6UZP9_9CREN|nr:MAG: hypothetical protein TU35_08760 [Thermoproteus sp. AZ2]